MRPTITRRDPDSRGYFGEFGGRFVPETLVEPIEALERAYFEVRDDPAFRARLDSLLAALCWTANADLRGNAAVEPRAVAAGSFSSARTSPIRERTKSTTLWGRPFSP